MITFHLVSVKEITQQTIIHNTVFKKLLNACRENGGCYSNPFTKAGVFIKDGKFAEMKGFIFGSEERAKKFKKAALEIIG